MKIDILASSSQANAYRIDDGDKTILIECGMRFKALRQALNFKVSGLAACFVTHEHQDHARALPELLRAGVDCYMSRGTAEALGVKGHRVHIIKALKQFKLGSWTVLPFDTVHDAAEPLGFLLASGNEKLLFATDTAYIKYRFKGLTHLLIEKNYDLDVLNRNIEAGTVNRAMKNRLLHSHMSAATCEAFLAAQDLSKIVYHEFIHQSSLNSLITSSPPRVGGRMLRTILWE
jgi:phosphoribosyl 1,2-cyclic phosphodiesterase